MSPTLATFIGLAILIILFAGIVAYHIDAVRRYERETP